MNFIKKNFKLIVGIIIGAILISGISVYATGQYLASQVIYKNGKNVEQALNDLYKKQSNNLNGINLFNFKNNNINTYFDVFPSSYSNTTNSDNWYYSSSEMEYNNFLNNDFEISSIINFVNNNINDMGGTSITLLNNDTEVSKILLRDNWEGSISTQTYFKLKNTVIYDNNLSGSDRSGRYAIIKRNNNIYFYYNNDLISSTEFSNNIEFNKLKIEFYKSPNHNTPSTSIQQLYIGDILNY